METKFATIIPPPGIQITDLHTNIADLDSVDKKPCNKWVILAGTNKQRYGQYAKI